MYITPYSVHNNLAYIFSLVLFIVLQKKMYRVNTMWFQFTDGKSDLKMSE